MFLKDNKTKTFKCISFLSRMTDECHFIKEPVQRVERTRLQTTQSFDELTERVVAKSEYVKVDRVAEMKRYKVSDFSLENLISVGAINSLKSVSMSKDSIDLVSDLTASMPKV